MAKGKVSFEQWSYELQTLHRSYSNSGLREGIQHSLRGAAADTVCNMGPNVPLDMILKKLTIIYQNVKSFDLLMKDFYRADQGEDETIPFFATRIEGLLSQIRERFPNQLPHQEEQRLLKDHLFHRSRISTWDSVKYCFMDASVDYMHFLRSAESLKMRGRLGKLRQPQGWRQRQQPHYPHQGRRVDQTAQISTTPNRYLGGGRWKFSFTC